MASFSPAGLRAMTVWRALSCWHVWGCGGLILPPACSCRLKDADTIGAPTLGVLSFPAQKLFDGEVFDGWMDLLDLANKPLKECSMRVTISFR